MFFTIVYSTGLTTLKKFSTNKQSSVFIFSGIHNGPSWTLRLFYNVTKLATTQNWSFIGNEAVCSSNQIKCDKIFFVFALSLPTAQYCKRFIIWQWTTSTICDIYYEIIRFQLIKQVNLNKIAITRHSSSQWKGMALQQTNLCGSHSHAQKKLSLSQST